MRAAAVWLALALAGCYSPSPAVGIPCSPEGRCPAGQTCDLSQSPPVCLGSLPGDAGADGAPDAFVGCIDNNDCTAANPICDTTTHGCRGCTADLECDGICTEYNGQCLSDPRGIFLAETGNDVNACTRAQPCRTWGKAAATIQNNKRTIVILDGSYSASGVPVLSVGTTGGRIVISGEDNNPDGAFFSAMSNGTNNPQVVNIAANTDIVLEGVTIRNGGNDGLRNFGDLLLYRVAVTGNNGVGVESNVSNSAQLHIWESSITANQKEGLNAQKGPVEILRSYFAHNLQGGIVINQCSTTITNTMIVRNGQTSTNGGIRMQNLNGLPQSLSFLTVAYNVASNANIAGLSSDTALTISNSILYENNNASTGVEQICPMCTAAYSLFSGTIPIGMGDIGGSPDFVDITVDDFHLQSTSAAKDTADSAATVRIDYDGNPRPSGSGFDMGADELP